MSEASVVAIIIALVTTVGVKLIESIFGRARKKEEDVAKELEAKSERIKELEAELKEVEREADEWKEKVYTLREEKNKIETQLMIALDQIGRESNERIESLS